MTDLHHTLSLLATKSATSVVARSRFASSALNAALLKRLSSPPGSEDSLLADLVFESIPTWESARCSLEDLRREGLLHSDLVTALDGAGVARMPRSLHPWTHQLNSWNAAAEGLSYLVSSRTGSGKTECFMIPMLNDLLSYPSTDMLGGVQAILIYPLNASIESRRERLAAWTANLQDHNIKFALYNGLTPESSWYEDRSRLAPAEIGNRRDIRNAPPAILVTNVTMLEYLLLRAKDRPILEQSQGKLRWMVLDEVHGYIGSQAAEIALLLRRVRAAFGVNPDQARLMATSATIGEGESVKRNLQCFIADLAGHNESCVRVIEGRTVKSELPLTGDDTPLEPTVLSELDPTQLWKILAPHPRIQKLKQREL